MKTILSEMNNLLDKFKNMSELENSKLGYFFSDNEFEVLSINKKENIRTYPIAAYIDYLQGKFNAIYRPDNTILIDESCENEINTGETNMYVIYADNHNIDKTIVTLNTDTKIINKSRVSYSEMNNIFGLNIEYFDFNTFIKTLNTNYITAILLLEDHLNSKDIIARYSNTINIRRLYKPVKLDSSNYNKIPLCIINLDIFNNNNFETILYDLSKYIKYINKKLSNEVFINMKNDDKSILIFGNYIWDINESSNINNWSKLLFGNNKYLQIK